MSDYSTLVDAETWAFIERTNSFYPPDAVGLTVAEQRAVYDRMCLAFHAGRPAGVTVEDAAVAAPGRAIPIRTYRKAGAVPPATILYFHGGGFVVGGLESHDDVCAELCDRNGCAVVSVDYRLAPEHVHPAHFDDALAAFDWLAQAGGPILLCGDSAGGNLAAAVAHAARGRALRPAGQVLIYPGLGGDISRGSHVEHAQAPMLTAADVAYYRDIRSGGSPVSGDPTLEPLAGTDFTGLPPTVIVTAQCDPLSSDGEAYRDRILAAGGHAVWIEEPGLVHGYLRARHSVGRARDSFARTAALAMLAAGDWREPG